MSYFNGCFAPNRAKKFHSHDFLLTSCFKVLFCSILFGPKCPMRRHSGLGWVKHRFVEKPEYIRCTNSKFCNKKHGTCWILICGRFMFRKLELPSIYWQTLTIKNRYRLRSTLPPPQTPKGKLSFKIYYMKRERGGDLTRFLETYCCRLGAYIPLSLFQQKNSKKNL